MTVERLQRLLSRAGVCSRRAAEDLLRQGRVTVDGTVASVGQSADLGVNVVAVDGRRVEPVGTGFDYFLLHKPRGYVSTRSDELGRRTVLDLVPDADRHVYPVGRLDRDSSGLILLTNDGDLAQRLLHPSHEVEKVYRVCLSRRLSAQELRAFAAGLPVDGRPTAPARISLVAGARRSSWYEVVLREGRKRQIRRMVEVLGAGVVQLVRVAMGPLTIRGLPEGRCRRLSDEEVKALRAASGGTTNQQGREGHGSRPHGRRTTGTGRPGRRT